MLEINKFKAEHFNKEAAKLLELIEVAPEEIKKEEKKKYSIDHKPILEIEANQLIEDTVIISKFDITTNKRLNIKKSINGIFFEISEHKYPQYHKLLNEIIKDIEISKFLSESFVNKKLSEWVFNSFKAYRINTPFCSFLIEEAKKKIENHNIIFSIDNLIIESRFVIGNSIFDFFSKEYIEKIKKRYVETCKDGDTEDYLNYLDTLKGRVYVCTNIFAEEKKALELAFEKCSNAIDVLKITSIVNIEPNYQIKFDIDKRRKFSTSSETLIQDKNEPWYFKVINERDANYYCINIENWEIAKQFGLETFNFFLEKKENYRCELTDLILENIKRYADAVSKTNLNQRIVDLYTVLESLLLKSESDPIIDSVSKYCSKLVTKNADDRKEIIRLLKDLYKVRSGLVHHGKEKDFNIEDLRKLQVIVNALLTVLISKLSTHKNKLSILGEIDDALLNAY